MAKIEVTDREGATHELEGTVGWSVMEVIRENNLDIEAACGGCCACATCHVYVEDEWRARTGTPGPD
jgi:2Fe-2S ferredoxin